MNTLRRLLSSAWGAVAITLMIVSGGALVLALGAAQFAPFIPADSFVARGAALVLGAFGLAISLYLIGVTLWGFGLMALLAWRGSPSAGIAVLALAWLIGYPVISTDPNGWVELLVPVSIGLAAFLGAAHKRRRAAKEEANAR